MFNVGICIPNYLSKRDINLTVVDVEFFAPSFIAGSIIWQTVVKTEGLWSFLS